MGDVQNTATGPVQELDRSRRGGERRHLHRTRSQEGARRRSVAPACLLPGIPSRFRITFRITTIHTRRTSRPTENTRHRTDRLRTRLFSCES